MSRKRGNTNAPVPAVKPLTMDGKTTVAKVMDFSTSLPQPVQSIKGNKTGTDDFVQYGTNNLYPNYLLKLYNDSSIHKSIIDAKVNYILGDGIVAKGTADALEYRPNKQDDIEDLMRKLIKDYLIFNYFAVEVVYNMDGTIAEINHISASKIRTNTNHTKFWYTPDWADRRIGLIDFEGWSSEKAGSGESKVYFYSGYTPSAQSTYPTPEYSGAIKSIEIDIAIKDFHLNNIHNSFSGNTIISFFRGEPTPEIKDEIVDSVSGSYSGTKGDKIIFQFLEKDEKEPTVTQLSPSEWNEAYLSLKEGTVEDIIIAHGVTSPMLFGIKTEGQLGGATELETAYSIFRQLWVKVKRREIVSAINDLIGTEFGEIEIVDKEKLFPVELSDTLREKVMTIDEIRKLDGLEPLKNGEGARLLGAPVVVKEDAVVEAENMGFSRTKEDDLRDGVNPYKELSEDEEMAFREIGLSADDVVVLETNKFSKHLDHILETKFAENPLTNYLMENNLRGKTIKEIQSDINEKTGNSYTIPVITAEYARLVALRIIPNTKLVSEQIINRAKEEYAPDDEIVEGMRKVEIRYSYDGPADEKNRAFCHRLVRAGKFYSREDIQKIADLFGYDVFNYKGGFNCRHSWMIHSVVRRG